MEKIEIFLGTSRGWMGHELHGWMDGSFFEKMTKN